MRVCSLPSVLLCLLLSASSTLRAQRQPVIVEHGRYTIHLLLHPIGTEEYTVTASGPGRDTMTTVSTTSDRGTKHTSTETLEMGKLFAPLRLEQTRDNIDPPLLSEIKGASATVREDSATRTLHTPPVAYMGFGSMPASLQMMMMRYWQYHHQPARLPILRASTKALPLEIRLVGHDTFFAKGMTVRLARYTVANMIFGREVLWMNDSGRLIALRLATLSFPWRAVDGLMVIEPADETRRSAPSAARGTPFPRRRACRSSVASCCGDGNMGFGETVPLPRELRLDNVTECVAWYAVR